MRIRFLFNLLVLFLTACSTFKEVHYFKDRAGSLPNFYKLEISGWTCLLSARYLSGYFDEEAINIYFNELSQPEKGAIIVQSERNTSQKDDDKEGVAPLTKGLENRRLVMILSGSSDAIATQIGSFVENKATLTALARLASRDRVLAANNALAALEEQKIIDQMLVRLGDALITNFLDDSTTTTEAEIVLVQFLNALASELGNRIPFTGFEDAIVWLDRNRQQILSE